MMKIKTFPVFIVTIALGILGQLASTTAEAAIVSGTISGTWQEADGTSSIGSGFNVGDTFTATYTYEDTQVQHNNYSVPGQIFLGDNVRFLSFSINSGGITYSGLNQNLGYIQSAYYDGTVPSGDLSSFQQIVFSGFLSTPNYGGVLNFAGQFLSGQRVDGTSVNIHNAYISATGGYDPSVMS